MNTELYIKTLKSMNKDVHIEEPKFISTHEEQYECIEISAKNYSNNIKLLERYNFIDTSYNEFLNNLKLQDLYTEIKYGSNLLNKNISIIFENLTSTYTGSFILTQMYFNTLPEEDQFELLLDGFVFYKELVQNMKI